jgi:arylsulfatase A-like enzyme
MIAFLLVVFDGLRPDMVRIDTTPNLVRFAVMGTRFARARSVFPSETRVCSASIATGCLPRRHGLVANQFAHPLRPAQRLNTGLVEKLRDFEQETGSPLLGVPTMGKILADAGRECVVLSSGTTGQTHVLNPRADMLGQVTLSAHGPHGCSSAGRRLLAELQPPPAPSAERAAWIADLFRTRFLPSPPAVTILWLCEPDSSGHHAGLGSPAQFAALRTADAAFGRILDDWEAGPQREALQIAVASDHGHARISGNVDAAAALAEAPAIGGCTLLTGSSGGIFVPGADPSRVAALAAWLTRQDWCGTVHATGHAPLPPGVLPRDSLLADHPRAAHVLYTLRANGDTTLSDGSLTIGGGTHGGLSSAEMSTVLFLVGSHIARGHVSNAPAGLIDLAPTALTLLGLAHAAVQMDGRALVEPRSASGPIALPAPETLTASINGFSQRLVRTRLGDQVYIDEAYRFPR